jgi:hypothetical protein
LVVKLEAEQSTASGEKNISNHSIGSWEEQERQRREREEHKRREIERFKGPLRVREGREQKIVPLRAAR